MTDSTKISRRDWFRLRPGTNPEQTDRSPQPDSMGQEQPALQPIAQPVNHDGMDLSELPPMREAILSPDQVQALFADIASLATDILLMQRSTQGPRARGRRASAAAATTSAELNAARDALLSGQVPRLQIRYRWQDADWIDTLELRSPQLRLVRIVHKKPVG